MASPEQQRATERRRYAIAIVLALLAWYLRGAPFYSAPRHARSRAWLGRSPPVPLEMDVISVAPLALPRLTRDPGEVARSPAAARGRGWYSDFHVSF